MIVLLRLVYARDLFSGLSTAVLLLTFAICGVSEAKLSELYNAYLIKSLNVCLR